MSDSLHAWEVKLFTGEPSSQCEDCSHHGWRPYIRYQDGTLGWLCETHYRKWIHTGHFWPQAPDAEIW